MASLSRLHRCALIAGASALAFAPSAAAYDSETRALCAELAEKIGQSGRSSVGVADFTDVSGNVTELGRFLAEEFAIGLDGTGAGFRLVDRNHLTSLLKEHNLSTTGLIDPQTARKLGRIAGVDVIVTGFLTPFGDDVHLTVKALETDTAVMLASAKGRIPRSATIDELMQRGIVAVATPAGGAAPAGGGTAPAVANPPKLPEAQVVQDVIYELQGCSLANQTIACELLIQNRSKNRTLRVDSDSVLYDDQGNEYSPSSLSIANNHTDLTYYSEASGFLPTGITVRATLTFEGILPEASKIATMILLCDADRTGWEQVEFRAIDLDQPQTPRLGGLAGSPGSTGGGIVDTVVDETKSTARELAKDALKKWKEKLLEKAQDR